MKEYQYNDRNKKTDTFHYYKPLPMHELQAGLSKDGISSEVNAILDLLANAIRQIKDSDRDISYFQNL